MTDSHIHTEAILLRSADYREADRIITVLTPDHGRISAIARGARSSRRRFAGALEPFSVVEMTLQADSRGLYRLEEARINRALHGLISDLLRMGEAGRCLEAIRSFAPEETPEPELFEETRQALVALDGRPSARLKLVRLCFLARLLDLVGLSPELRRCGVCSKQPAADQPAQFDTLRGHLVCRDCGRAALVLSAEVRHAWMAAAEAGVAVEPSVDMSQELVERFDLALLATLRAHAP